MDTLDKRQQWIMVSPLPDLSKERDLQNQNENEVMNEIIKQEFRASAMTGSNGMPPDDIERMPCFDEPQSRMSHSSVIFGGIILSHGGYNPLNEEILEEMIGFDIGLGKWVKVKQTKKNKFKNYIGKLMNHTMTVISEPVVPNETKDSRIVWLETPQQILEKTKRQMRK